MKFKAAEHEPRKLNLSVNKEGDVTAGDIQDDQGYQVINPDQLICTLDRKDKFEAELEVKVGRGFATGEDNKRADQPIGVIPIDSIFSPVTRVKYAVESTRVGQHTDYDKLILEVWTDGRITPETPSPGLLDPAPPSRCLRELRRQRGRIRRNPGRRERGKHEAEEAAQHERQRDRTQRPRRELPEQRQHHHRRPARQKTEAEMLKYRNFGKKSLNEIKEKLQQLELGLGMKFDPGLVDMPGQRRRRHGMNARPDGDGA